MAANSHNSRRTVIVVITLIGLLLTACGAGQPAPSTPKVFTIGVVSGGSNMDPVLEAFKAGIGELGYTEGKNLAYIYNGAASSPDKLAAIAQSVVSAKVDLILALSTPATKAAQQATAGTNIPVVFLPVIDPVQSGIIQSVDKPGGNLTGIRIGPEVNGQRLEWLIKITPKIKRVYVPHDPGDDASVLALAAVKDSASKLGLDLDVHEMKNADEITAAVNSIPDNVDAIYIMPGSQIGSRLTDFIKASLARKLPLTSPIISQIDAGALMSYSWSPPSIGKQAARMVDHILKGTRPADVPTETSEFFLAINLKTAQMIGLDIPDDILRQAANVKR
jgi:putative ABC transport system substrate-binding protein